MSRTCKKLSRSHRKYMTQQLKLNTYDYVRIRTKHLGVRLGLNGSMGNNYIVPVQFKWKQRVQETYHEPCFHRSQHDANMRLELKLRRLCPIQTLQRTIHCMQMHLTKQWCFLLYNWPPHDHELVAWHLWRRCSGQLFSLSTNCRIWAH